jgi:molybdopterin-guanine dinucleotide biosynthesis protein A
MQHQPGSIPAIILAGGRASRMGGGDKGLLILADRPMLSHVIARIAPQVGALALNANGPADRFASFELPVLPDSVPNLPGPLAGVLAGMDWAASLGATSVITVAADTPFFPQTLVVRLGQSGLRLAASKDADGTLRQHPTFGCWPVELRNKLRQDLVNGMRRVGLWAAAQGAELVEFPSIPTFDPFFNINTPEDLARAEALASAK